MDKIIISTRKSSVFNNNKVLSNTYCLLAMTMAFSAITATLSTIFSLPSPGLILTLVGFYGLMFLTNKYSNSSSGIIFAFAFTGFLGYCLGPILNYFLSSGMGDAIVLALGGTSLVFFCCSAWVLISKKDMSFLHGMMITGFVVLFIFSLVNLFLQMPLLHLVISSMFIIFSAISILWETNNIINGGENNYIRATVSLYVSIYNIFISFLNVLGCLRNKE